MQSPPTDTTDDKISSGNKEVISVTLLCFRHFVSHPFLYKNIVDLVIFQKKSHIISFAIKASVEQLH